MSTMPNPQPIPATAWEDVTPAMAAQMLQGNTNNRNIQGLRVARYTRDMAEGHWTPTHQGIAFTTDGTLIDGQHRLLAQVQANVTLRILVTRHLPLDAQRYVDQGRARNAGDFFDGSFKTVRAAAIRQLVALRHLGGVVTPTAMIATIHAVTIGEIHAFADTEPGIVGDVEALASSARIAARFTPVGAASLLMAAVTFPTIGEGVLEALRTGAGIETGSPVLALRNYRHTLARHQGLATCATLKVFRATQRGQTMRILRVSPVEAVRVDVR